MKQIGCFLLLFIACFSIAQELEAPQISHQSGFYKNEFQVTISHPDPTVTILYTLDGSEPKIENLTGKEWFYKKQYPTNPGDPFGELLRDTIWTYVYSGPLEVKDRSDEQDKYADISSSYFNNEWYLDLSNPDSVNVFKGTILRIMAYSYGDTSNIITRNYFVTSEGKNRYSLPITCLAINPEKFFSYNNGLNVPGVLFDDWRDNNPTEPISIADAPANFRAKGSNSELELNYAYIVDGEEVLNHGVGLRIHGVGSRYFPNRSYRLYARSEYGQDSFNYPYFKGNFTNKFKRIVLRNSGQDCMLTMLRDGALQEASKKLNFDTQGHEPTILFVNGEYFGIYNIRERYDDKYFEKNYNINPEELDFLENDGLVKEGDNQHYLDMINYLSYNSLSDESVFKYVQTLIDPINITDYFITGSFIGNIDWPQNNNEFWRKKTTYNLNAQYGHDGRWRWLLKDLDYSFGHRWNQEDYTYDDLSFISLENEQAVVNRGSFIFRKLLENVTYENYFISRYCDILNSTYKKELLISIIHEKKSLLVPEMSEFIQRWNPSNQILLWHHPIHSYSSWESNVNEMIKYAENRPYWVRKHIQNRFNLGDNYDVVLDVSDTLHGYIHINTIDITSETDGVEDYVYPWVGTYFDGVPITLKAIAKEGYKFSHWSGEANDTTVELTLNIDKNTHLKANFKLDDDSTSVISSLLNTVKIYPNPANKQLYVLSDEPDLNYTIFSIEGREIMKGALYGMDINIQSLNSGRYILRLEKEGVQNIQHFIKQ